MFVILLTQFLLKLKFSMHTKGKVSFIIKFSNIIFFLENFCNIFNFQKKYCYKTNFQRTFYTKKRKLLKNVFVSYVFCAQVINLPFFYYSVLPKSDFFWQLVKGNIKGSHLTYLKLMYYYKLKTKYNFKLEAKQFRILSRKL